MAPWLIHTWHQLVTNGDGARIALPCLWETKHKCLLFHKRGAHAKRRSVAQRPPPGPGLRPPCRIPNRVWFMTRGCPLLCRARLPVSSSINCCCSSLTHSAHCTRNTCTPRLVSDRSLNSSRPRNILPDRHHEHAPPFWPATSLKPLGNDLSRSNSRTKWSGRC